MNKNILFPCNIRVNGLTFSNNADFVFICGEYHGRYQDDDCQIFSYNINEKVFNTFVFTTRGYCTEGGIDKTYIDINNVNENLLHEIITNLRISANNNKERLLKKITDLLKLNYPKKYSEKSIKEAVSFFDNNFVDIVNNLDNFVQLVSLSYDGGYLGYNTSEYFYKFLKETMKKYNIVIKKSQNRKVKLYGENFTGIVTFVDTIIGSYGRSYKIIMQTDSLDKPILFYSKFKPNKNECITINGIIDNIYDEIIYMKKVKRIDDINQSELVFV